VAADHTCHFADLGVVPVSEAERFMCSAVERRARNEITDLLILLAHPPTVATGLKDRLADPPRDLLVGLDTLQAEGIAFVSSVRGGGITYHWPGQLVCYPVLALEPAERNIPAYMTKLEEVAIQTLRCYGIEASRRRDSAAHLGLWVDGRKVVSMGVRISRWVTSFGLAINLEGDYAPSRYVRPCGIEGIRLTTVEEVLGTAPLRSSVVDSLKQSFVSVFRVSLEPLDSRSDMAPLAMGDSRTIIST
jgi:lipoate-protein ligase B